jgi:AbrB family looped-hinge helix DNA binding protein
MTITIDKAGRVVIPARLRRLAGLKAGTPLSASYEEGAIKIVRDVRGPEIESHGKRRIARPTSKDVAPIDISAQIEEERNRWPG